LRTDGHGYSPAALQLIVEAAGRLSFADAAFAVGLAGLRISPRHIQHLTELVGSELAAAREAQAQARRRRQLRPRVAVAPAVAAVEVDGGRLRTRAAGCGPGVHQAESKEDKVACLVSLRSERHEHDPQPEPPPSFLQPRRVQRLVRQMKGLPGESAAETPAEAPAARTAESAAGAEPPAYPAAPRRLVRTCVASLQDSHAFGPLVAGEAQSRDFYRAGRRAFVADGQAYNWSIQQGYFADFEPIVDFLHVLCYLYRAAWAVGTQEAERWARYVGWLRGCWQGRVAEVLEELLVEQGRLGEPPEREDGGALDQRRLAAEAVSYLQNNAGRMDYPHYRREGLPVTSSLVESLVAEFNARVKGPEKFWNRPAGAEAMLQVRAALLSEDDRLARHFAQRPGSPYRRRKKTA
jgi:hypothetical protein